jgi:hypothetical protein
MENVSYSLIIAAFSAVVVLDVIGLLCMFG